MGVTFFSEAAPREFGKFDRALITMYRLTAGDTWVNRPVIASCGYDRLFISRSCFLSHPHSRFNIEGLLSLPSSRIRVKPTRRDSLLRIRSWFKRKIIKQMLIQKQFVRMFQRVTTVGGGGGGSLPGKSALFV